MELAGVGVNLTCYGSTKPTPEKMQALLAIAARIEKRIGRKLEIISGGATSSYTLVHWGTMPAGINHLRIGENILLGKDLQVNWGIQDMDYLRMDGFTLRAEVVEVREKPTYPIGEFAIDAFGRKPVCGSRHTAARHSGAGSGGCRRAGVPHPQRGRADRHRWLLRPLHRRRRGLPLSAGGGRYRGVFSVLQPPALRHIAQRHHHSICKLN